MSETAIQQSGQASIGDNLRALRKEAGLSQGALALAAGIVGGQPTISQYETGKVTPTIPQLRLLAKGLGRTLADLVEGI